MTLVVARKIGNSISVVSDTILTHPHAGRMPLGQGVLKTTIISPGLCVSFAGAVDCADTTLRSLGFKEDYIADIADIVEHFLGWHRKTEQRADYILAFGPPHSRLVVVKKGVAEDTSSAWIGSQTAFSRFQNYMLEQSQADLPHRPLPDTAVVRLEVMRVPRGDDDAILILSNLKKR